MSKGRYEHKGRRRRRTFGSKSLALVLACVLLVGGVIGGTLAWLTAKTNEVTNVFTTSDIDITLQEHKYDPDKDELTNTETTTGVDNYKMIPGWTIPKDPWVTVKGGSEDCWVFIKVEEKGGNVTVDGKTYSFDNFIGYEIDTANWTPLTDDQGNAVAGVYVTSGPVNEVTKDRNIKILDAGTYTFDGVVFTWDKQEVLTKPDVTKEMMNAVTDTTKPTLTFTAYASQYWKNNTENFTAYEAWKNVSGN